MIFIGRIVSENMTENSAKKITTKDILAKGSLIAIIISVPTLIVFFGVWTVTDDLIFGAVGGLVTNFIALGFSFKIVSKKFVKKPKDNSEL